MSHDLGEKLKGILERSKETWRDRDIRQKHQDKT